MREIRLYGSEGGGVEHPLSLPLYHHFVPTGQKIWVKTRATPWEQDRLLILPCKGKTKGINPNRIVRHIRFRNVSTERLGHSYVPFVLLFQSEFIFTPVRSITSYCCFLTVLVHYKQQVGNL